MKNNVDDRLDRLFSSAREEILDTAALEEHFETRLMARIRELQTAPVPWYFLAWRAIPAFAAIAAAITISVCVFSSQPSNDMFADLVNDTEESQNLAYLIGEYE